MTIRNYNVFIYVTLIIVFISTSPSKIFAQSQRHNFSMEIKSGLYFMKTSQYEVGFGRRHSFAGAVRLNYGFFKQIFQVGLGIGYMREHDQYGYLYIIPIETSINVRLKFSNTQIVIPYIGSGIDYYYFKSNLKYLDPNEQFKISTMPKSQSHVISSFQSNRSGYHINVGLLFLLNKPNSIPSNRFDEKYGINETYITLEVRYTDLSNFKSFIPKENDLGGWSYYTGLLFEF